MDRRHPLWVAAVAIAVSGCGSSTPPSSSADVEVEAPPAKRDKQVASANAEPATDEPSPSKTSPKESSSTEPSSSSSEPAAVAEGEDAFPPIPSGAANPLKPFSGEEDPDATVTERIQKILDINPVSFDVVSEVFLSFPRSEIRQEIIDTISNNRELKDDPDKFVRLLRAALRDPSPEVRDAAAEELGEVGDEVNIAEALPELIANLEDDRNVVNSLVVIQTLGEKAAAAVPHLRWRLRNRKDNIELSIDTLISTGSGKTAIPEIQSHAFGGGRDADDAFEALAILGAEDIIRGAMTGDDHGNKLDATAAAKHLPHHNEETVAVLLELLAKEDSWQAADALGSVRPTTQPIIDALVASITHKEDIVRRHAAESLGRVDLKTEAGRKALETALEDEDEYVADSAREALSNYESGGGIEAIVKSSVKSGLADTTTSVLAEKAAVKFYAELTAFIRNADKDPVDRAIALASLRNLSYADEATDEQKEDLLKLGAECQSEGNPLELRIMAMNYADEVVLSDDEQNALFVRGVMECVIPENRRYCIAKCTGRELENSVPEIVKAAQTFSKPPASDSATANVAMSACRGLARFPNHSEKVLPIIAEHFDKLPWRADALKIVRDLGGRPELMVPMLMKLTDDETYRDEATAALSSYATGAHLKLDEYLKLCERGLDEDWLDSDAVVAICNKLKVHAAPLTDKIIPKLEKQRGRSSIIESLGAIGPPAKNAAAPLFKLLNESDDDRSELLMALASIKARGDDFAKAVAPMLKDREQREEALKALTKFGAGAKAAADAVAPLLDIEDDYVRQDAVVAIGSLGVAPGAVSERLETIAKGDDKEASCAVVSLLRTQKPDSERYKFAVDRYADLRGWIDVNELSKEEKASLIKVALESKREAVREVGKQLDAFQ